ncbi:TonB family protein [Robertkochia marina]|uniref:TonB family protein n=1 Tax=Robertkochia marina TaxID=1227945 RepID=A0A4S3M5M8_9FLAO|nr:energy transducer TonB [Robertkochia marina]THD69661.1 TonB family protein [Robertkochia marina]TRZ46994.1 TonB family protein [Robertkochia marina]
MNLNNKQLSLIITFCVMGIFVLTAFNLKLRDKQEEEYLYELTFDEELLEEEIPEEMPPKMTELETHMAFNEANESRYAQELEEFKTLEELQAEIEEMEAQQEEGEEINELSENLNLAKEFAERLKKQKEAMQKLKEKQNPDKEPANIKRRTTITYSLKDRYKLEIPNPIYTCESFGKVVINIEVNANGQVTDASFNSKSSTTTNKCLVENAIYYAQQARFNADAAKSSQPGSITYLFQGD